MGEINQDPSMEEILASIKRVIAEDGRPGVSARLPRAAAPVREPELPPPPPPETAEEEEEEDVLELQDPVREESGLISADAAVASRQSLAALAAMRQAGAAAAAGGDGPLEAVVREMLKPMLKDWLDQRLPEIVEDMVSREIARITGKSF